MLNIMVLLFSVQNVPMSPNKSIFFALLPTFRLKSAYVLAKGGCALCLLQVVCKTRECAITPFIREFSFKT